MMLFRRLFPLSSCLLPLAMAVSACGGGGGGSDGSSSTPAGSGGSGSSGNSGGLTVAQQWDFSSADGWQLTAEPASAASTTLGNGLLKMAAALYITDPVTGSVACPKAAAEVALTESHLSAGSYERLAIDLKVSRWDLGLGQFDTDVPRLELVYRGQRYTWNVVGFNAMPGTLHLEGGPSLAWTASYNGVAALSGAPTVSADTSAPLLRVWLDGCSQGMSQSVELTSLAISGA
ncbi:hypothetical protein LRH25_25740 [Ideonella azotifigens]|uniref:Lipoprotein n=1 Tax=Ideonella azotifigens TaxID=513160 RepID=A0ABN1KD60_9BURK|nr:hypothetical protein [Ideonella azotifigens]MCD2343730.1 hypothetical protein [Ideonella azotifigens]